ncbi:MAG TPA: Na/Pi cotransporter family protein [Candidatus Gemmiger avium]|nr:Na/Pi cotransporter family protein [Candidatus Gemmiger avium]
MSIFNVFSLFGGLALFLFGMDVMGKGLEKQAGGRLQIILEKLSSKPLRGFLLGLLVTAVIQSSSATTVMVVGFVNSGVMQLGQAINVIMGANVGTTVTAWILSLSGIEGDSWWVQILKPANFSPVLALIGIILYMFCKSDRKKDTGSILLGFAILMTGMEAMSDAVAPLSEVPAFTRMFTAFENPILGLLAGAILTGIIQSSSASVGILQALSATGAVSCGSAIPIILGQNIGTCVTAMLASVGTTKNARRAALVHLYFNVIGATGFLVVFYPLRSIFQFQFVELPIDAMGIAVVHTTFNLLATALMLPFARWLEKLAYITIPDEPSGKPESFTLLDERLLSTPAVAVEQSRNLAGEMASLARTSLLKAMSLTEKWDDKLAAEIEQSEELVDHYEDVLGTYLVHLSSRSMTLDDSREVSKLLNTIADFERIGDHAVNVLKAARELHDKQLRFSEAARQEMQVLTGAVQEALDKTLDAFRKDDVYLAGKVEPIEQVVDELTRELKARHILRLQNGVCTIELGFIFSDLLNNYERVADHCSNVAVAVIEMAQDSFDTHEYLASIKAGDAKFAQRLEKYRRRYTMPEPVDGE